MTQVSALVANIDYFAGFGANGLTDDTAKFEALQGTDLAPKLRYGV